MFLVTYFCRKSFYSYFSGSQGQRMRPHFSGVWVRTSTGPFWKRKPRRWALMSASSTQTKNPQAPVPSLSQTITGSSVCYIKKHQFFCFLFCLCWIEVFAVHFYCGWLMFKSRYGAFRWLVTIVNYLLNTKC